MFQVKPDCCTDSFRHRRAAYLAKRVQTSFVEFAAGYPRTAIGAHQNAKSSVRSPMFHGGAHCLLCR
ncbi:hypothetical protein RD1_0923 [Roseobacter denitrificans OCh 114]|uniref:Uncharacterized protein n=1 Tax=Roseobacter denitrificans (strain ATCC 33942 / OCh 114) TaxID=375451 RepID=Q16BQ2_ROSDO|nr:hypothetical protein RD1_0923 [Roseobacter denitrificans OCh 114]